MTTLTAPIPVDRYPALFEDYARSNGITENVGLATLFAQFRHQYNISPDDKAESITVESRHMRDDYFGPEIVVTTPKTKAPKKPSVYRELQAQCKALGLKANGSTAVLQARLNKPQDGDYIKVKTTKTRAKTAKVKTQCHGLTYRQTQRLVSWFRSNMPKNYMPTTLVKNIGWDNVSANANAMLTAHGWAANLSKRSVQELVDYCGIINESQLVSFLETTGLLSD